MDLYEEPDRKFMPRHLSLWKTEVLLAEKGLAIPEKEEIDDTCPMIKRRRGSFA